jgi:hypothetical protein
MKTIFLTVTLLISTNLLANNLRDQCENAYYANAGGVTQLHQYTATVNWGKLSDYQLTKFEDIIYAEKGPLSILSESNFESRSGEPLSSFKLKETKGFSNRDYIITMIELSSFPAVSLSCL